MVTEVTVLHADAIDLALQYYNDATGFVQIMEANHLDDWAINAAIVTQTTTDNLAGDAVLMLPQVIDLVVGMAVYCGGYNTYGVVTQIELLYTTPSNIPFAQGYADIAALFPIPYAGLLPALPQRILPAMGKWTGTKVSIDPVLDKLMTRGSTVTFAVSTPTTINIPVLPPGSRGKP